MIVVLSMIKMESEVVMLRAGRVVRRGRGVEVGAVIRRRCWLL